MSWDLLRQQLQRNFEQLSSTGKLYARTIDRDKIWQEYLAKFDPSVVQEHTCNACKSFIRQYGSIVGIKDNTFVSIWDNIDNAEYNHVIENLKSYLSTCPVENEWVTSTPICGNNSKAVFTHFVVSVDKRSSHIKPERDIDSYLGMRRSLYQVLHRGLSEITLDSLDTVKELIDSKSIYRGDEHKSNVEKFSNLKSQFTSLSQDRQVAFVWKSLETVHPSISGIRNTVIGTLLTDISEGKELDHAVRMYESKVAPANYKRPTAIATPRMIENAKKELEDNGLTTLLSRRPAVSSDLNIYNILYKSVVNPIKDIFDTMKDEVLVNPSKLTKQNITIDDFITEVLPTSKKVEILPLNNQLGKFVTLITSESFDLHTDNRSLFKWNNPFSWSYTQNMADSIKENVVKAGGSVVGDLRASLQWNESGKNIVDFDLHCYEFNDVSGDSSDHIYYNQHCRSTYSKSKGQLDVDMISPRSIGIENIVYSSIRNMSAQKYEIKVQNFSSHASAEGFTVEIEIQGQTYLVSSGPLRTKEFKSIAIINREGSNLVLKSKLEESQVKSISKWEIPTNMFIEVNVICKSPNYWETGSGNKHYFFLLDKCKSNESHKIFYNEFLDNNLDKYRKVFEVLSSKLSIQYNSSIPQLSGLGFSSTLNDTVILRVTDKSNKQQVFQVKVQ